MAKNDDVYDGNHILFGIKKNEQTKTIKRETNIEKQIAKIPGFNRNDFEKWQQGRLSK